MLPFQPFPLQEAVEVQAVEVVSKGSHTQVVVDKPRREQSQQRSWELLTATEQEMRSPRSPVALPSPLTQHRAALNHLRTQHSPGPKAHPLC